jgi:hypothetical protein
MSTPTPTNYTREEHEALLSWCVFNAVFSFVEEYGKEEGDFINWLEQRGESFSNAITHCGRLVEVYADQLSKEENN